MSENGMDFQADTADVVEGPIGAGTSSHLSAIDGFYNDGTQVVDYESIDTDQDRYANEVYMQLSNGHTVALLDLDNDGIGDVLAFDLDGDGVADVMLTQDGDNDSYELWLDHNGDGQIESAETTHMTKAQLDEMNPQLVLLMEQALGWANVNEFSPPVDAVDPDEPDTEAVVLEEDSDDAVIPDNLKMDEFGMIGEPDDWSEHWFRQAENGNCAPAAIAQIVAEYTDSEIADEQEFLDLAEENGWMSYEDGEKAGMTPEDSVALLNASGVPASLEFGDMNSLAQAISDGRGVIAVVDSGEIWAPAAEGPEGPDNSFDHVVVISGIDAVRGVVYLSDPGNDRGDQMQVPIQQFAEAWADGDNAMIVCDEISPFSFDDDAALAGSGMPEAAPAANSEAVESTTPEIVLDSVQNKQFSIPEPSALENTIDWVTARPWILVPVVLTGAAIVREFSQ